MCTTRKDSPPRVLWLADTPVWVEVGTVAACERRAWTLHRAGLTVDTTIRSGRVPEAIGARALEIGTDVIVMATHDRSRTDRLLRRNAAIAVVGRTELPVLLATRGRARRRWSARMWAA